MRTPLDSSVTLEHERAALDRARRAAAARLAEFSRIGSGGGADALSDEYIAAVVAGAVEKFQRELVVFGRIDDDQPCASASTASTTTASRSSSIGGLRTLSTSISRRSTSRARCTDG
jgi:hypothetical protein